MTKDIIILNHIHQTADMGKESLLHLYSIAEDDSLREALDEQIAGYETTYKLSEKLLKERSAEKIEDVKPFAVIMADLMSDIKLLKDPSSSKIADMVIKGSTMGITKLTKLMNSYEGEDKEVSDLAHREIENERNNIEAMKVFL